MDLEDDAPCASDPDAKLIEYFERGFPAEFPRVKLRTGGVRKDYVRFWASIRSRAAELLGIERTRIRAGLDFAITELVHCKSRDEVGVPDSLPTCVSTHWDNVQEVMQARVFVALGAWAARQLGVRVGEVRQLVHPDGGIRWLLALPHPNAFDKKGKTFGARYEEGALQEVRMSVRASMESSAGSQLVGSIPS
jgi:hypothetical protein